MWNFETLYLVCFTVGIVYALVAGFFAGVLGGDGDVGGDMGHDGIGGDLADGDFSGTVDFSPMSPTVISAFLLAFGGSGYLYINILDIDPKISLLPALVTGFLVGAALFLLFSYIYRHTQGGTEIDLVKLIGKEAEVITPIPESGIGEIAYYSGLGRTNSPARSESGHPIPKHSIVIISKIVGNVYLVRPAGDAPQSTEGQEPAEDQGEPETE